MEEIRYWGKMFVHLQWSWRRIQRKRIKKHFTFFPFPLTQPNLIPPRDNLLWSFQIHIDMSHAILHSLIFRHCAHWTHCSTYVHYLSEPETTHAVPETTTRQKSLVKDLLHFFSAVSAASRGGSDLSRELSWVLLHCTLLPYILVGPWECRHENWLILLIQSLDLVCASHALLLCLWSPISNERATGRDRMAQSTCHDSKCKSP